MTNLKKILKGDKWSFKEKKQFTPGLFKLVQQEKEIFHCGMVIYTKFDTRSRFILDSFAFL